MGVAELSARSTDRSPADAAEPLAVEAKIIPLADGDADRRDRQLRAIVSLLRGARDRAAEAHGSQADSR